MVFLKLKDGVPGITVRVRSSRTTRIRTSATRP
jgi:hypothetical protein